MSFDFLTIKFTGETIRKLIARRDKLGGGECISVNEKAGLYECEACKASSQPFTVKSNKLFLILFSNMQILTTHKNAVLREHLIHDTHKRSVEGNF